MTTASTKSKTAPWRAADLSRLSPPSATTNFTATPSSACKTGGTPSPSSATAAGTPPSSAPASTSSPLTATASLLPGSDQARWIDTQLKGPARIRRFRRFHHAPPACCRRPAAHRGQPQSTPQRDRLPRLPQQNLASAACQKSWSAPATSTTTNATTSMVWSTSSPAAVEPKPYRVERTSGDLYQQDTFPNYHVVRFNSAGKSPPRRNVARSRPGSKKTSPWKRKTPSISPPNRQPQRLSPAANCYAFEGPPKNTNRRARLLKIESQSPHVPHRQRRTRVPSVAQNVLAGCDKVT